MEFEDNVALDIDSTALDGFADSWTGQRFTFDAPVFTHFSATSGTPFGKTRIDIDGSNFGAIDSSPTMMVGDTSCVRTVWQATSSFTCYSPQGEGKELPMVLTVSSLLSTAATTYTYWESPRIETHASPANGPSSGMQLITVIGLGFGDVDLTASLSLGKSSCATASWTSWTTVLCTTAAGVGADQDISLTSASLELFDINNKTLSRFTYDAPVFSQIPISNFASTAGVSVTIIGTGFGPGDAEGLRMKLGTTACATTVWVSQTSITCALSSGIGAVPVLAVEFTAEHTFNDVNGSGIFGTMS